MAAQTIRSMNERGSVTIDHEIREVLDIKEKEALLRLQDIEVVKVENGDVSDLPDETCQTICRINKRGTVRIDQEVRQVLGVDGKRAMLKIGNIEVAKILSGNDEVNAAIGPAGIGAIYARVAASWSQTKHQLLQVHPQFKYPPSKQTAAKIAVSWTLIALLAVGVLGTNGSIEALAAGDPIEWAGLIIALALGIVMMVWLLPDRKETVNALLSGDTN